MVEIDIFKLTPKKIYYKCPFCWKVGRKTTNTNYFKNGNIIKSAIPTIHHHGNGFNQTDYPIGYKFNRGSHCLFNRGSVDLIISENTEIINF